MVLKGWRGLYYIYKQNSYIVILKNQYENWIEEKIVQIGEGKTVVRGEDGGDDETNSHGGGVHVTSAITTNVIHVC